MADRIFGEVKWFQNDRGYGFVIDEADPQSEYFAHYSYVKMDGYKTLKAGQKVSFELVETERGLQAQEILVEGE